MTTSDAVVVSSQGALTCTSAIMSGINISSSSGAVSSVEEANRERSNSLGLSDMELTDFCGDLIRESELFTAFHDIGLIESVQANDYNNNNNQHDGDLLLSSNLLARGDRENRDSLGSDTSLLETLFEVMLPEAEVARFSEIEDDGLSSNEFFETTSPRKRKHSSSYSAKRHNSGSSVPLPQRRTSGRQRTPSRRYFHNNFVSASPSQRINHQLSISQAGMGVKGIRMRNDSESAHAADDDISSNSSSDTSGSDYLDSSEDEDNMRMCGEDEIVDVESVEDDEPMSLSQSPENDELGQCARTTPLSPGAALRKKECNNQIILGRLKLQEEVAAASSNSPVPFNDSSGNKKPGLPPQVSKKVSQVKVSQKSSMAAFMDLSNSSVDAAAGIGSSKKHKKNKSKNVSNKKHDGKNSKVSRPSVAPTGNQQSLLLTTQSKNSVSEKESSATLSGKVNRKPGPVGEDNTVTEIQKPPVKDNKDPEVPASLVEKMRASKKVRTSILLPGALPPKGGVSVLRPLRSIDGNAQQVSSSRHHSSVSMECASIYSNNSTFDHDYCVSPVKPSAADQRRRQNSSDTLEFGSSRLAEPENSLVLPSSHHHQHQDNHHVVPMELDSDEEVGKTTGKIEVLPDLSFNIMTKQPSNVNDLSKSSTTTSSNNDEMDMLPRRLPVVSICRTPSSMTAPTISAACQSLTTVLPVSSRRVLPAGPAATVGATKIVSLVGNTACVVAVTSSPSVTSSSASVVDPRSLANMRNVPQQQTVNGVPFRIPKRGRPASNEKTINRSSAVDRVYAKSVATTRSVPSTGASSSASVVTSSQTSCAASTLHSQCRVQVVSSSGSRTELQQHDVKFLNRTPEKVISGSSSGNSSVISPGRSLLIDRNRQNLNNGQQSSSKFKSTFQAVSQTIAPNTTSSQTTNVSGSGISINLQPATALPGSSLLKPNLTAVAANSTVASETETPSKLTIPKREYREKPSEAARSSSSSSDSDCESGRRPWRGSVKRKSSRSPNARRRYSSKKRSSSVNIRRSRSRSRSRSSGRRSRTSISRRRSASRSSSSSSSHSRSSSRRRHVSLNRRGGVAGSSSSGSKVAAINTNNRRRRRASSAGSVSSGTTTSSSSATSQLERDRRSRDASPRWRQRRSSPRRRRRRSGSAASSPSRSKSRAFGSYDSGRDKSSSPVSGSRYEYSSNNNGKDGANSYSSYQRPPPASYKFDDTTRNKQMQVMSEERKVVYVGSIPEGYTRDQLRERFARFGVIREVSLHFRDRGENYGFVTFETCNEAYNAVEKGNDFGSPRFKLCFGGRRQFCRRQWYDLDSAPNGYQSYDYVTAATAVALAANAAISTNPNDPLPEALAPVLASAAAAPPVKDDFDSLLRSLQRKGRDTTSRATPPMAS